MDKFTYGRSTYVADGSTYICAFKDDEHWCDVSVCLADYGMKPADENCIFVPAYKMNPETLEVLERDLFAEVINKEIPIGFGTGWLVKVKDNWKELAPALG